MLVRFSSIETESITMFGGVAAQLIKMLGASGVIPGAIHAEDIPDALQRLRQQLHVNTATNREDSAAQNEVDAERESTVALITRAGPLIDILERAGAANAPLMWEKI